MTRRRLHAAREIGRHCKSAWIAPHHIEFDRPLPLTCFHFLQKYRSMQTSTKLVFNIFCSPNKRSFRGPGGVGRGLDLGSQAQKCARDVASVASRGLQEPSTTTTTHHHPPPPTTIYHHLPPPTTNDRYDIKVSNTILGPKLEYQSVLIIKQPFQTRTDISAWLSKIPGMFPSFARVWSSKRAT